MRAPSIKSFVSAGFTTEQAKTARQIIKNELNRETLCNLFPRLDAWVRSCYNRPRFHDVKMNALDELLETYGVEAILDGMDCKLEYLNSGDTYTPTLCFHNGHYIIRSWGDIVEKYNY